MKLSANNKSSGCEAVVLMCRSDQKHATLCGPGLKKKKKKFV